MTSPDGSDPAPRDDTPALEVIFEPAGGGAPRPLLQLQAGASVAIVGASASRGHMIRALAGLERPRARPEDGGEELRGRAHVRLDGLPLTRRARWRELGVIFEQGGLWTGRSVRYNLELPFRYHGRRAPAGWQARLAALSDALGLTGALDLEVESIDLSLRRRVALARELSKAPRVLLFDAPQLGLSDSDRALVFELLDRRRERERMAIVFGDPDGYLRPFTVDRLVRLEGGRFRPETAPTERPHHAPRIVAPLERRAQ